MNWENSTVSVVDLSEQEDIYNDALCVWSDVLCFDTVYVQTNSSETTYAIYLSSELNISSNDGLYCLIILPNGKMGYIEAEYLVSI